MSKNKRVVLGVSGSIAAYKAADLIRRLQDVGFDVSVVMTKSAEKFITPLTLASLAGEKVYQGMFDDWNADRTMPHIDLAEAADVLLVAPATANIIGKIANGIADDLLTCLAMTTKAPICIAPAMNTKMFQNPIVQENCNKLKQLGMKFIEPSAGKLACGSVGEGRLADISDIVKFVVDLI